MQSGLTIVTEISMVGQPLNSSSGKSFFSTYISGGLEWSPGRFVFEHSLDCSFFSHTTLEYEYGCTSSNLLTIKICSCLTVVFPYSIAMQIRPMACE